MAKKKRGKREAGERPSGASAEAPPEGATAPGPDAPDRPPREQDAAPPEAAAPPPPATAGPLAVLHTLDGALFAIERGFIAFALSAITVIVFIDVVQRRLVAPDSKIGGLLAKVAGLHPRDPFRAVLDGTVAPIVLAVVGMALLWLGVATYERHTSRRLLSFRGGDVVVAIGLGAVLAALGWAIVKVPSRHVCSGLLVAAALAYVVRVARERAGGWQVRVGVTVLATAGMVWAAQRYFASSYDWTKGIATFLLLWVGFLGTSVCVYAGKHIRLELGEKLIPPAAHRYVGAAGRLAAAAVCAFFAYLGVVYIDGSGGLGNIEPTEIPAWIITAAIPVSFAFAALRFLASGISALAGGRYGDPAVDESLVAAREAAAREGRAAGSEAADAEAARRKNRKRLVVLALLALVIATLPLTGKGGMLGAALLTLVLLGAPLFVVIALTTITCFLLWTDFHTANDFTVIPERMRALADNQALLAVPMFVLSGAIMSAGQIASRLVGFARALLGWMPGGLAISAVLACMIFAAISGSSPATVVAIGGMMGPTLIKEGYKREFSLGLVTSAGSLGILIPPSLPMIVYCIVNQRDRIEVERLFAAGFGPGLVIGGSLMAYSLYRGVVGNSKRDPFDVARLWQAAREGFWSLLFPVAILGGIYTGIFNAVESAAISVVYALVVELYLHRALKLSDVPRLFQETALLLGSLLVIMVAALSLSEFLEGQEIPQMAARWVASLNLSQWQFLLVVNVLLLVVGCLMDIMSAIFIFVPLLGPMAAALDVNPIHFAIVFIVNLEIGYLTPPVGLNLFVASTLFNRPIDFIIRSVLPFIAVMFACLLLITYWPGLTAGGAELIMGPETGQVGAGSGTGELGDEPGGGGGAGAGAADAGPQVGPSGQRVQSLEEMMAELEAEQTAAADAGPEAADAGPTEEPAAPADGGTEDGTGEDDPEPSF